METDFYTIQQISNKTGLTVHTLRYYEKMGLLNGIQRDVNGYRQYSEADISWIRFLIRLQVTGMKISDMKRFSDLRSQGEATFKSRRELLESHRKGVAAKIQAMKKNLRLIDEKVEYYKRMEGGSGPGGQLEF